MFIIPGLIMMAWAINAFSNNASSILQQKFQRAIDDQLSSPASPVELLLAFTLGGFLRGDDRGDPHLHGVIDPRGRAGRSHSGVDPGALSRRLLLLPARECSWACGPSSSTTCPLPRPSCCSR
ncbi:MAG: hypothetical protein WKF40_07965 [Thermoleophilaceae bacterium]